MSKVLAFFADGLEMVEGLAVVDVLRRGRVDVDIVSIKKELSVVSSHSVQIACDKTIDEVNFEEADMIFLPGGIKGKDNLEACGLLREKILEFYEQGKYLAAICASPSIYGKMGLLKGKKATVYPGFEDCMTGAEVTGGRVEADGNMLTSRGMGTSIDFGLKLLEILKGSECAEEVAGKITYR